MTTLELAQAIGCAVLEADRQNYTKLPSECAAQAVLKVVRESGHWFCRVTEDPKLGTVDVRLPFEDAPT